MDNVISGPHTFSEVNLGKGGTHLQKNTTTRNKTITNCLAKKMFFQVHPYTHTHTHTHRERDTDTLKEAGGHVRLEKEYLRCQVLHSSRFPFDGLADSGLAEHNLCNSGLSIHQNPLYKHNAVLAVITSLVNCYHCNLLRQMR